VHCLLYTSMGFQPHSVRQTLSHIGDDSKHQHQDSPVQEGLGSLVVGLLVLAAFAGSSRMRVRTNGVDFRRRVRVAELRWGLGG